MGFPNLDDFEAFVWIPDLFSIFSAKYWNYARFFWNGFQHWISSNKQKNIANNEKYCFPGPNNSNIPRIVSIIAEAFFREAIEPSKPEGYRMTNIIRQIQSNETFFQSVIQTLSPELQQALHNALHTAPSTWEIW